MHALEHAHPPAATVTEEEKWPPAVAKGFNGRSARRPTWSASTEPPAKAIVLCVDEGLDRSVGAWKGYLKLSNGCS